MAEAQPIDRFLRLSEVIDIVGLSKAMIYRKARAGTFPKPYKPGGASSRWSLQEVVEWQRLVKEARHASPPRPPVDESGGDAQ